MTLALSIASALAVALPSQDAGILNFNSSDRPGMTVRPQTLAKGGTQLEFGYSQSQTSDVTTHNWGGWPLLRHGWSDAVELRFNLPSYLVVRDGVTNPVGSTQTGFGVKYAVKPAVGAAPAVSILAGTSFITGATDFRSDRLEPYLALLAQWNVDATHAFSANLGVTRRSDGAGSSFDQKSVSVQYSWIQGKMAPFIEAYAISPDVPAGQNSQFVRGGAKYSVNSMLQFDWFVNRGLNGAGRDYVFGAGFTVKFH